MGTPGREVELKYRLPDEAALTAVARLAAGMELGTVHQVNHFFDTRDRALDRNRLVLRLRNEDGRHWVTAKGPSTVGSGALAVRDEVEVEVSQKVADRLLDGTDSPLAALATTAQALAPALWVALSQTLLGQPLVRIGQFENDRRRILWHPAGSRLPVTLELDRTTFPGGIRHYEVELELSPDHDPQGIHGALATLLRDAGVEASPASGKAKRFFQALDGRLC